MNTTGYVPVKVETITKNNNKKVKKWYLDVSKLGLKELIELRKELLGVSEYSIKAIDGVIWNTYNVSLNSVHYFEEKVGYAKALKQDTKDKKIKLRRKTKEKRGKRK